MMASSSYGVGIDAVPSRVVHGALWPVARRLPVPYPGRAPDAAGAPTLGSWTFLDEVFASVVPGCPVPAGGGAVMYRVSRALLLILASASFAVTPGIVAAQSPSSGGQTA